MKAQGSMTYLLIIAVAILVASVSLIFLSASTSTSKNYADINRCRTALEQVHNEEVLFGDAPPNTQNNCNNLCQPFGTQFCPGGVTMDVIEEFTQTGIMPERISTSSVGEKADEIIPITEQPLGEAVLEKQTECNDNIDNDMDASIDLMDLGCISRWDDSEGEAGFQNNAPECNDDIDNDNDGYIDYDGGPLGYNPDMITQDTDCLSQYDDSESLAGYQGMYIGVDLGNMVKVALDYQEAMPDRRYLVFEFLELMLDSRKAIVNVYYETEASEIIWEKRMELIEKGYDAIDFAEDSNLYLHLVELYDNLESEPWAILEIREGD